LNSTAWSKKLRDSRSALDSQAEALKSSQALERKHQPSARPAGGGRATGAVSRHAATWLRRSSGKRLRSELKPCRIKRKQLISERTELQRRNRQRRSGLPPQRAESPGSAQQISAGKPNFQVVEENLFAFRRGGRGDQQRPDASPPSRVDQRRAEAKPVIEELLRQATWPPSIGGLAGNRTSPDACSFPVAIIEEEGLISRSAGVRSSAPRTCAGRAPGAGLSRSAAEPSG